MKLSIASPGTIPITAPAVALPKPTPSQLRRKRQRARALSEVLGRLTVVS